MEKPTLRFMRGLVWDLGRQPALAIIASAAHDAAMLVADLSECRECSIAGVRKDAEVLPYPSRICDFETTRPQRRTRNSWTEKSPGRERDLCLAALTATSGRIQA